MRQYVPSAEEGEEGGEKTGGGDRGGMGRELVRHTHKQREGRHPHTAHHTPLGTDIQHNHLRTMY